nr:N-6 DNA methylase [Halanaerobiales bacterium]
AKLAIKKKLLSEFNLHTIVRLPNGVFAPYTSISTNVLFFDKSKPTEKIDYYQVPLPEGLKNGFTKTRPLKTEHLQGVKDWWHNRDKEDKNAYSVTVEEIEESNYNLDIKNPNNGSEGKEYSLNELLTIMRDKSNNIHRLLGEISEALKGVEE